MSDAPTPNSPTGHDSLTVRDNRTGREYELAITDGTIRAADLKQIAVDGEPGLATYDPGFVNTASCRSSVTFIDGDAGHPGVPRLPDRAAGRALHLPRGGLPAAERRAARTPTSSTTWTHAVTHHTFLHENIKQFIQGFRYDAHPMGMLMASVSALSTFYPDASDIADPANRQLQITRLIAKMPTLGAFAYRNGLGKPYVYPDNDLSYVENFLAMLFKMSEPRYAADPRHRQGPRRAVHPARRPRAELLDQRRPLGGLVPGRPLLGGRGRHRRALRPAARRGQRGGAQDAAPDRHAPTTSPPSSPG